MSARSRMIAPDAERSGMVCPLSIFAYALITPGSEMVQAGKVYN